MWNNRLSEFLLKNINNDAYPCVFINKSLNDFGIISVYVDDINIFGTRKEIKEASSCLKMEFEMKDLGKTKYYLDLQIEHFPKGIFVHQSTYLKKVLERFYIDKSHPLSTPMVVRPFEGDKDPFRPKHILGPEVPHLNAIWSFTLSRKLHLQ